MLIIVSNTNITYIYILEFRKYVKVFCIMRGFSLSEKNITNVKRGKA